MLLVLCLTLSLNAVPAATTNNTTADTTAQDKEVNTSTSTSDNSQKTSTSTQTAKTTTTTQKTDAAPYQGLPDTGTKSTSSSTNYAAGSAAAGTKTIKVLIYTGTGASYSCYNGVRTALASANANKLLSGVTFSYAYSSKLTSSILSGYNVLVMPGGTGGKVYLNTVSSSVIKNFVSNGGGYVGICAGAFAAAAHVDGWYNGWGIAPHVNAKAPLYEGKLTIYLNSGSRTISYYNGPVMYLKSSGPVVFANYNTRYKGYRAIVGDYYGNGRTVLCGPHPELSPQYPDIVANLVAWAAKTTATKPAPKVTVSQVAFAASNVKAFYERNKRLPNTVNINGNLVSMPKFLNLQALATLSINSGSKTAIFSIRSVSAPTKISGTIKSGNVVKSEFLSVANRVKSFISSTGRAPNYVRTHLGNMSFPKVIYMLSKILNFYKIYNRLPSSIAMR